MERMRDVLYVRAIEVEYSRVLSCLPYRSALGKGSSSL